MSKEKITVDAVQNMLGQPADDFLGFIQHSIKTKKITGEVLFHQYNVGNITATLMGILLQLKNMGKYEAFSAIDLLNSLAFHSSFSNHYIKSIRANLLTEELFQDLESISDEVLSVLINHSSMEVRREYRNLIFKNISTVEFIPKFFGLENSRSDYLEGNIRNIPSTILDEYIQLNTSSDDEASMVKKFILSGGNQKFLAFIDNSYDSPLLHKFINFCNKWNIGFITQVGWLNKFEFIDIEAINDGNYPFTLRKI
jgi:hypothetical protein